MISNPAASVWPLTIPTDEAALRTARGGSAEGQPASRESFSARRRPASDHQSGRLSTPFRCAITGIITRRTTVRKPPPPTRSAASGGPKTPLRKRVALPPPQREHPVPLRDHVRSRDRAATMNGRCHGMDWHPIHWSPLHHNRYHFTVWRRSGEKDRGPGGFSLQCRQSSRITWR